MHRQIAEAVQQMWQRELGVTVNISNQEWKVYLDSKPHDELHDPARGLDRLARPEFLSWRIFSPAARTTTPALPAPNTTACSTPRRQETDPGKRDDDFQRAEAILLDAAPIVPVYFYTNPYLLSPSVHGWAGNVIDYHPFADLSLQP